MRRLQTNGISILLLSFMITLSSYSLAQMPSPHQDSITDKEMISEIYRTTLRSSQAYTWLHTLCFQVGHRLSGSPASAEAVRLMKSIMDTMAFDTVFLQEVMVPYWNRGEQEILKFTLKSGKVLRMKALAIGNSIGTGEDGLMVNEIIEVPSIDSLNKIPREKIEGKIVFFNGPMDSLLISTFTAYGRAVGQRVLGASNAAKYGAEAVIVRSMTTETDTIIHTGTLYYLEEQPEIPALNISTADADFLSRLIRNNEIESIYMRTTCGMHGKVLSHNVIGEITGSMYPDQIILVGGHLDSWDVGQGAHDDGAGCVQSMDVVNIFTRMNYTPKHTIRVVLYMNEENGSAGAKKYAEIAREKGLFHLAAIESDAGGFTPRGFGFSAHPDVKEKYLMQVISWQPLFTPYGISLRFGGSGADVSKLKFQKGLLGGLRPDSQRYFDYHHTIEDTFDKVNSRELELGAAAMAALVYMIDKHGLD